MMVSNLRDFCKYRWTLLRSGFSFNPVSGGLFAFPPLPVPVAGQPVIILLAALDVAFMIVRFLAKRHFKLKHFQKEKRTTGKAIHHQLPLADSLGRHVLPRRGASNMRQELVYLSPTYLPAGLPDCLPSWWVCGYKYGRKDERPVRNPLAVAVFTSQHPQLVHIAQHQHHVVQ